MTLYALPVNGIVAEIFQPPAGLTLTQCFASAIASQFVDISAISPQPQPGWTVTGGPPWSFSAPASPNLVAIAKTFASGQAQNYYNGLMTPPNGYRWQTYLYSIDYPQSYIDITAEGSLAASALSQPSIVTWPGTGWFDMGGTNRPFTASQFLQFSAAVADYVKTCYINLQSILQTIAAASTVGGVQAIDVTAGYPSANGP
jgi:hypothetical protein